MLHARFFSDVRGNIMVPATMMLVAAVGIGGAAIDMSSVSSQRASMQDLTDQAALAAAREFALASNNVQQIESVARQIMATANPDWQATGQAHADAELFSVDVTMTAQPRTYFPGPWSSGKTISVSASAQLSGQAGNVCLIALADSVRRSIELNNRSQMTAESCGIYANSTDQQSMYLHPNADIVAEQIYLSGGFRGKPTGTLSDPVTDAPPIDDPLASRPMPTVGACDHTDMVLTEQTHLSAGVYCGGLVIDGGNVSLFSGTYIIKDGPLTVINGGILDGDNVGFFLTGDDAKINFEVESTIDLSGPLTGEMAGLLFYADPANPLSDTKGGKRLRDGHVISSDNARRLVGTIYLPDDKLILDGDSPIADRSEYTVIIAQAFELNNGPNLVIQTDYGASDVPVPDGAGPMQDANARLVR